MASLEEITQGVVLNGILSNGFVTVEKVEWIGDAVIEITYKDSMGNLGSELLFRDREPGLEILETGKPWSFDGDAGDFRLVSEAWRIRLAYLFDPLLAVHISLVEPLPHQITAVYEEMIPKLPLRFLLADDPGAGKTVMTGLLIKELIARGDLHRCMVVCPGNLVEQWQDELYRRFHLPFGIMTNDKYESARTGNWFQENPLAICRLDKLSRNEDVKNKLRSTDWDLIVCDEAHKMSASFFAGEVKRTKRYQLGRLLSGCTRHFLLLTATPHNGKEEDFQLFMALLDGDRFEGKFRDGVHSVDVSDLMRRMLKEDLVKFDGKPLFPERKAYSVEYALSPMEKDLYEEVTAYVREEFNRADNLDNAGRKGTVGFALTILQRRLASSPEAIYQSIRRRRERLEKRCMEETLQKKEAETEKKGADRWFALTADDLEDLDDAPENEVEEVEERLVDLASAAQTISELKAEIAILQNLESRALQVRQSRTDRKWEELSKLLQNQKEMFDPNGLRRKLIIFTEHRDTLNYLQTRISSLIGRPEAVLTIHGAMGRDERRKAEQLFIHDKTTEVLIATDAAGEGINLQQAHLMVNYDLPWNPNRLEQRFGRIHRIGQTEVCHLWNMVSAGTREGDVFQRLLRKLDTARDTLGGKVFDILGKLSFDDKPLRQLLIEAVRYGDDPEIRRRLDQVMDHSLDREKLRELIEENALARDAMDISGIRRIRENMERAEARRLQPHFIAAFFIQAFRKIGGSILEREKDRYEISHVPEVIRLRDKVLGMGQQILKRYQRITFEKNLVHVPGKPVAEFVCPGHPLLDGVLDLIMERHRDVFRQGAVLIDDHDPGESIRVLICLEHGIQDAGQDASGKRRMVSTQMQFVEVLEGKQMRTAGYAPYLDLRPPEPREMERIKALDEPIWIQKEIESLAKQYAVQKLVPGHMEEVSTRRKELVDKTMQAVKDRLTKEISHWDFQAENLKAQEAAGRKNARINSQKARQRADELSERYKKRMEDLTQKRIVSPLPPVILGGAKIIPAGLLKKHMAVEASPLFSENRQAVEDAAMQAVMEAEKNLGYIPHDVSRENCGYDIESKDPDAPGKLRFIEVKGRAEGADTVTVTRNEILTALNKPNQYILALVVVDGVNNQTWYIRNCFEKEIDFSVTSVNYNLQKLISMGGPPS